LVADDSDDSASESTGFDGPLDRDEDEVDLVFTFSRFDRKGKPVQLQGTVLGRIPFESDHENAGDWLIDVFDPRHDPQMRMTGLIPMADDELMGYLLPEAPGGKHRGKRNGKGRGKSKGKGGRDSGRR